ncbi:MAG: succinylglutamate desuccinylase/aspartoacylase family protein [Zoogloeaceae bacterium]|nr:succinylglutamate desuccinylase/aspartoacylase family protein [Zoogloeaceae bacterium]
MSLANHSFRPPGWFVVAFLMVAGVLPAHATPAAETIAWCEQLGKRLKSVEPKSCQTKAFAAGKIRSVQGLPLMVMEVSAKPTRGVNATQNPAARPVRILLVGGIHGDELTSVSIVFRWLNFLQEPNARTHHWRIAPLANPDGLLAEPSRRTNGNGVDLNRNFPTPDWRADALPYWKRRTQSDPRRFPGKAPMSEPETQWLFNEIEHFKPDVIVSIHAPYGVLDYDGPAEEPPHRFGRLNLNQLGVYPGSLGNFGGVFKNIPVITIELSNATAMSSPREQRQIWDDMLAWIQKHIVPNTAARK